MTLPSIAEWFSIAKPQPTDQDLVKQIAFHIEEFAEMLVAIGCSAPLMELEQLQETLMWVSESAEHSAVWLSKVDKVALLDAMGDQVVTSVGVMQFMGADALGAVAEVNRSNYTKFTTDEQGNPKPYLKSNGKIGKNPETYQEPQLQQFLKVK